MDVVPSLGPQVAGPSARCGAPRQLTGPPTPAVPLSRDALLQGLHRLEGLEARSGRTCLLVRQVGTARSSQTGPAVRQVGWLHGGVDNILVRRLGVVLVPRRLESGRRRSAPKSRTWSSSPPPSSRWRGRRRPPRRKPPQRQKRWRRIALVAGPLLLGLALFTAWWEWRSAADSMAHAASEKGSPLMSPLSNARPRKAVTTWLCATISIGCTAAPVRPPSLAGTGLRASAE